MFNDKAGSLTLPYVILLEGEIMADIIVGTVFFVALAFAAKRIYKNFSSGSCNCGSESSSSCSGGASCPHCHPQR